MQLRSSVCVSPLSYASKTQQVRSRHHNLTELLPTTKNDQHTMIYKMQLSPTLITSKK